MFIRILFKKVSTPLGMLIIILTALIAGILALGCNLIFVGISTDENIYQCNTDSDCIIVQDGCCDCGNGGKNTAINKIYLDYWNQKTSKECRDKGVCPAVISGHWTCFTEPKCIKNRCQLAKKETRPSLDYPYSVPKKSESELKEIEEEFKNRNGDNWQYWRINLDEHTGIPVGGYADIMIDKSLINNERKARLFASEFLQRNKDLLYLPNDFSIEDNPEKIATGSPDEHITNSYIDAITGEIIVLQADHT